MLRKLRIGVGVGLALFITGTMAMGVIVLGTPYKLLIEWWVPWRNPFEQAPRLWAWVVYEGCYVRLLGVRSEISHRMGPTPVDRRMVCVANHPATAALPALVRYLTIGRSAPVVFVAKVGHLWNIFVGIPLLLVNGAIFIRRSDREASLRSIRRGLNRRHEPHTLFVIFPDQHRPTPERIAADRRQFAPRIAELERWLWWTLVPRSGGLWKMLQVLGSSAHLVNLTQVLGSCQRGLQDAARLAGQVFYLEREEVAASVLPHTEEGLREWLTEKWRRKNDVLRQWIDRSA